MFLSDKFNFFRIHKVIIFPIFIFCSCQLRSSSPFGISLNITECKQLYNGSYNVSYQILIANFITDTLTNFRLINHLTVAFPEPVIYSQQSMGTASESGNLISLNDKFGFSDADSIITNYPTWILPSDTIEINYCVNVRINGSVKQLYENWVKINYNDSLGQLRQLYSCVGNNLNRDLNMLVPTPINLFSPIVVVPNIFSPNGDNINDLFKIKGISNYTNQFKIFNRWGNIVYQCDNYDNSWSGEYLPNANDYPTKDTKTLNNGTYFFVLNLYNELGYLYTVNGFLELIK